MSVEWSDTEAAATALVTLARQRGIDLAWFCGHSQFLNQTNGRYIHLSMTGTAVGYDLQGKVAVLPQALAGSAGAFHGMWSEAGVLPNVEAALAFVTAWLVDGVEVDQLPVPERQLRRQWIG